MTDTRITSLCPHCDLPIHAHGEGRAKECLDELNLAAWHGNRETPPTEAPKPDIDTLKAWRERMRLAAGDAAIHFSQSLGNMQLRAIAQEQERTYDAIGDFLTTLIDPVAPSPTEAPKPVAWSVCTNTGDVTGVPVLASVPFARALAEGERNRRNAFTEPEWKKMQPFSVVPLYLHPAAPSPAVDREAVRRNELAELIYNEPHGLMSYEDIIAVADALLAAYDLTPKKGKS